MENNNLILSEQKVCKEYQIPELIDLNNVKESVAGELWCTNGSGNIWNCNIGSAPGA